MPKARVIELRRNPDRRDLLRRESMFTLFQLLTSLLLVGESFRLMGGSSRRSVHWRIALVSHLLRLEAVVVCRPCDKSWLGDA